MTKTTGTPGAKLSWRETYKAMAAAKEDWSDLEATTADGFRSSRAGKPEIAPVLITEVIAAGSGPGRVRAIGTSPPPGEPDGGAFLLRRQSPALAELQPPADADAVLRRAEPTLAPRAFEAQPDP